MLSRVVDPDNPFDNLTPDLFGGAVRGSGNQTPGGQKLWEAVTARNYPRIYAALKQLEEPPSLALCEEALECTANTFSRILEHRQLNRVELVWLMGKAALYNRPEHLKLLLERSDGIPWWKEEPMSPLDYALAGRSLKCVELLVAQPGMEVRFSHRLLEEWTQLETGDTMLDFCLTTIAQKAMPDCAYPFGPVPLPPGLQLHAVVQKENWALAERMCREGDLVLWDTRWAFTECGMPRPVLHRMLLALAQRHPLWAKQDWFASLVALAAVLSEDGIPGELETLVKGLRRKRRVELDGTVIQRVVSGLVMWMDRPWNGWVEFLDRWQQRLGPRPVPLLQRYASISWSAPEELDAILSGCSIGPPYTDDIVSNLAQAILTRGTPRQVMRELRKGGALDGENFQSMLHICSSQLEDNAATRAKRAALMAHMG